MTDVVKAPTPDLARQARIDAIARLVDIAGADWDPPSIVRRPHVIPVLVRHAMCATHLPDPYLPDVTCGRCGRPSGGGHDDVLLTEIQGLSDVAAGRTWAVMDALHDGLPDRPEDNTPDAADLITALNAWSDAA